MKAQYLGHVVFYVEHLDRSLAFYRDLLGFKEVGRTFGGKAAALTSGRTHHELLLIEIEDAAPRPVSSGPALGLITSALKSAIRWMTSGRQKPNWIERVWRS